MTVTQEVILKQAIQQGIRATHAAPARFCLAELAGRLVELAGEGASATLTLAIRLVRDAQEQSEPVAWVTSEESSFYPPDAAESGIDLAALVVVRIRGAAPVAIPTAIPTAMRVSEQTVPKAVSSHRTQRPSDACASLGEDESIRADIPRRAPTPSLHARASRFFREGRAAAAASLNTSLATAAERLLRSGAFGLVVLDLGNDANLALPIQARLAGLAQHHHAAIVCLTEKSEGASSLGSLVSLRAQVIRQWLSRDRFRCELRVLKDKRRGPTWSHVEVCRGPFGLR